MTDCQFTLTLKKTDCYVKIARWALFLQDFTYTIEHYTGNLMRHIDALSRNSLPTTMVIKCQETIAAKLRRLTRQRRNKEDFRTNPVGQNRRLLHKEQLAIDDI